MSKQYGLIVPHKEKIILQRPSVFDESDAEDSVPTGLEKSLKRKDKISQYKAIEEDPTVYQYDEIYDELDKKRRDSKLSQKNLDRKPKYINRLLAAADRRKKENERRIERQVQKERETEGNEFKDKDSFVTSSYKKKLEELKLLEEQEKREDYLEAIGDVVKQGNLDGFYRHLYDQKVNYEDNSGKKKEKNASGRIYRQHRESDTDQSETEGTVKEHIPSNLDADSDFSIDSSDSEEEVMPDDEKIDPVLNKEPKKTSTQAPEDVIDQEPLPIKKLKIDVWTKRTVGKVYESAVQRYFERKALREL